MQKWEYTTLTLISNEKQELEWTDAQEDNRSASERLNELGEEDGNWSMWYNTPAINREPFTG